MTAGFPVRAHSSNCLALVLATVFLVPSVLLFCAVHKAFDRSPLVLATGLVVRVGPLEQMSGTGFESIDPNVSVSLVQEQAQHRVASVAQNIDPELSTANTMYCDSYDGLATFGAADPVINLVQAIVQLFVYCLQAMPLQAAFVVSAFIFVWTAGPVILSKL